MIINLLQLFVLGKSLVILDASQGNIIKLALNIVHPFSKVGVHQVIQIKQWDGVVVQDEIFAHQNQCQLVNSAVDGVKIGQDGDHTLVQRWFHFPFKL